LPHTIEHPRHKAQPPPASGAPQAGGMRAQRAHATTHDAYAHAARGRVHARWRVQSLAQVQTCVHGGAHLTPHHQPHCKGLHTPMEYRRGTRRGALERQRRHGSVRSLNAFCRPRWHVVGHVAEHAFHAHNHAEYMLVPGRISLRCTGSARTIGDPSSPLPNPLVLSRRRHPEAATMGSKGHGTCSDSEASSKGCATCTGDSKMNLSRHEDEALAGTCIALEDAASKALSDEA